MNIKYLSDKLLEKKLQDVREKQAELAKDIMKQSKSATYSTIHESSNELRLLNRLETKIKREVALRKDPHGDNQSPRR